MDDSIERIMNTYHIKQVLPLITFYMRIQNQYAHDIPLEEIARKHLQIVNHVEESWKDLPLTLRESQSNIRLETYYKAIKK